jgi:hypothetical protein
MSSKVPVGIFKGYDDVALVVIDEIDVTLGNQRLDYATVCSKDECRYMQPWYKYVHEPNETKATIPSCY